jgi:hypothetical protein
MCKETPYQILCVGPFRVFLNNTSISYCVLVCSSGFTESPEVEEVGEGERTYSW